MNSTIRKEQLHVTNIRLANITQAFNSTMYEASPSNWTSVCFKKWPIIDKLILDLNKQTINTQNFNSIKEVKITSWNLKNFINSAPC